VLAVLGAGFGLGCLFSSDEWLLSIDKAIACLFLLDVLLRVASAGLEHYFNGEWNLLDFVLVTLIAVCSLALGMHALSGLFKVVRIFRASPLLKLVCSADLLLMEVDMLEKFKRLLGTVIIIVPLAARFIPLFLVVYYILGVAGMEIFYDLTRDTPSSASIYDSLSNFTDLIYTQFYLVQVLTEAGWSAVAFDYAARAGSSWALALLFFVLCHAIIVLVLAAVLKGIIWFVFITVSQLLDAQERAEKISEAKKTDMAVKVDSIREVEESIKATSLFHYDTLTKRILFEAKADALILEQMAKKLLARSPSALEGDLNAVSQVGLEASGGSFLFSMIRGVEGGAPSLYEKEEVAEEDIDEYMALLLKAFKINTTRFEFEIENCPLLRRHLRSRLTAPYLREQRQQNSLLESNHISCEEFNEKKTL
jgi:hypothetical protein